MDPDPVARAIQHDIDFDLARAKARGLRVAQLARMVTSALDGHGLVHDPSATRVIVQSVLAEALYGDGAIDLVDVSRC
jgi:hypothetical protein